MGAVTMRRITDVLRGKYGCKLSLKPLSHTQHSGRLESSERKQKIVMLLSDGRWHSTDEIRRRCGGVAVHSDISDLRNVGVPIGAAKYSHREMDGSRVFLYRLEIATKK